MTLCWKATFLSGAMTSGTKGVNGDTKSNTRNDMAMKNSTVDVLYFADPDLELHEM